jgi:hypothetical protein
MSTKGSPPTGLLEKVSIVRQGTTITILGKSFNPLNVHKDNPIWPQLDAALKNIGK